MAAAKARVKMEKRCLFLGRTETGIFAQALFGSAGCYEKTAGAAPFSDWETGEQLRNYIKTITPEDRKKSLYVLVNALGAGEYFGSNINADYFPWSSLMHEGEDYGYQTFLKAYAFQHHANKDPTRALGVPVLSALNHRMKRFELVTRLDREAVRRQGADSILTRIESGEFPDVSMGCGPKGSPILLADGQYVPIETVKRGDSVISHRGRARRVESTMSRPQDRKSVV